MGREPELCYIDVGGTFTDAFLVDEDGEFTTAKAPSTPDDVSRGFFAAIERAADEMSLPVRETLSSLRVLGYGATVALNTVLTRRGGTPGLVVTRGFEHLLAMGRGKQSWTELDRPARIHPVTHRMLEPLIPFGRVRGVTERIDCLGAEQIPLYEADVERAVGELVDAGADAIVVCFLWSFLNDAHEARAAEIARDVLAARGIDGPVVTSHEVSPVIRELPRANAATFEAYTGPLVKRAFANLEDELRRGGFDGELQVMQSAGGLAPARSVRVVETIQSGPVGGLVGGRFIGETYGLRNIITTDVGGTSFDLGLITNGNVAVNREPTVGRFVLGVPIAEVVSIGAGGGTIAGIDPLTGRLVVGHESAGADPGPVCYGRGGTRVTVTDAMLVLGIIDAGQFLGGRMQLDRAAAEAAIEEQIAAPLGLSVPQAAAGVRRIVEAQMADTLRELTVGRGHDPRDFVLYAYGGAGPMHCAGYGAELGVQRIVVPAMSMAQSAYGALASDVQVSAEQSVLVRGGGGERDPWAGMDVDTLEEAFAELEQRCLARLAANGIAADQAELSRVADVRYRRQTNELMIPAPVGRLDGPGLQDLLERFERAYEETYGKGAAFREAGVEIATLRVDAVGRTQKPRIARLGTDGARPARTRDVFDAEAGRHVATPVVDWAALSAGEELHGPAVVEHPTTTVYVAAGQGAGVDEHGNLIITTGSATA